MDDLLKEAIADAKAVRETALENAKMALEEAFTPRLKSMLAKKIQSEIEDEGTEDEVTEEEEVITLLDEIEKFNGQIYLLDSSTEVGKQIDSIGGIIALLRYPVYEVD